MGQRMRVLQRRNFKFECVACLEFFRSSERLEGFTEGVCRPKIGRSLCEVLLECLKDEALPFRGRHHFSFFGLRRLLLQVRKYQGVPPPITCGLL